jgi:aminoglycoside 6'-N-acetyltransferase
VIEQSDLVIRRMRDEPQDYALVSKWLSDERVLEFVYGRDNAFDLDRVHTRFGPRVRGESEVVPCILEFDDTPVGYMQYYPVEDGERYGIEDIGEAAFGIDMFIGEPDVWNLGGGTRAMKMLVGHLFSALGAARLVIDPRAENKRAIRCYEKSGFKKFKVLARHELFEGAHRDIWVMAMTNADDSRSVVA